MTFSRTKVLVGTFVVSTAWLGIAALTGARAEDRSEMQKYRVDDQAKKEKDQVDQQAKKEKDHVDERAQAQKDDIDRRNADHTKPTLGNDVTDAWITTKVKASFVGEKALKGAEIHVDTDRKGVVVLSGYVPNNGARVRAISLAWETKGVKKVDDLLQLKPTP